ncbi:MAG: hypothetical protein AB7S99_16065 [Pseudodonghicola sp.]
MLRAIPRALALLVLLLVAGPLRAAAGAEDLARLLRVDDLAQALHEEGLSHGGDLDSGMLDGQGGDHWAAEVARIYDTDRIAAAVRRALAEGLSAAQIAESAAFFGSPRGQTIVGLEISARIAMRDRQVEQTARAAYEQLLETGDDDRLAAIRRYVEVNDLIERNVTSAMNASYRFLSGMAEGGAIQLDDAAVMAQVWGEEEATRAETESWLYAYLLMAYRPLAPEDLAAYIAYADSAAGRALNAAMFEGFDSLYQGISFALGLRLAAAMRASRI